MPKFGGSKISALGVSPKWVKSNARRKNPVTCGDTDWPVVFISLHYVQHCITHNVALCATLHFLQNCIRCNIALCATLHYVQHCITCNIALRAKLHYVQQCITCNIALHATLH